MKAAVLFSDAHHTLHLVNVRVPEHKPTESDCERAAREVLQGHAEKQRWDYVGTLKNHPVNGPIWHATEGTDK